MVDNTVGRRSNHLMTPNNGPEPVSSSEERHDNQAFMSNSLADSYPKKVAASTMGGGKHCYTAS